MINDFFILIPTVTILFHLLVFGFLIYALVTGLKLLKEGNEGLKAKTLNFERGWKVWD